MLTDKKLKDFHTWGKNDAKHYVLNKAQEVERGFKNETEYYLSCKKSYAPTRLKTHFNYSDEDVKQAMEHYHEGFYSGFNWWSNKKEQVDSVLQKYEPIFKEAEKIAFNVDVSDIQDGFPCGSVDIYLKPEGRDSDLGKALRTLYGGDSYSAKVCSWSAYALPVKMPSHGQCMRFDERVCEKVVEFLESKGIPTATHSWID